MGGGFTGGGGGGGLLIDNGCMQSYVFPPLPPPPPYPKSVLCITGVTCNHFLRIAPGVCVMCGRWQWVPECLSPPPPPLPQVCALYHRCDLQPLFENRPWCVCDVWEVAVGARMSFPPPPPTPSLCFVSQV